MTEHPDPISPATAKNAGIPKPAEASEDIGLSMPPKVAAAVIAVMEKVPKLEKSERNTHGNYNFASIDGFLEALRPLCAKHGLIIIQDEESFELKQSQNKKGETITWLIVKFRFTLAHSSGETWVHRPARTIMVNAAMGAQAFGAAQSYALKQFMRALFQVATGEADVDSDPRPEFDRDRQEDRMAERVVKHTLRKDLAAPAQTTGRKFVLVDQFGEEVYQTENVDDYAERLSALLEKTPNLPEIEQLWLNNEAQVKVLPDSRAADVTALYEGKSAEFSDEPEELHPAAMP
ncbi:MAG: ERF family protein [Nitrospiraceae bacterium]